MIHPPAILVTCDARHCETWLTVPAVLAGSHRCLEQGLVSDHGWVLRAGKQFCCATCAEAVDESTRLNTPGRWPLTAL
jgi:hypothetical protein